MDCFDHVVVGTGPSGAAAALQLAGRSVLVIDAAADTPRPSTQATFAQALRDGDLDVLLGQRCEVLDHLDPRQRIHPKFWRPPLRDIAQGDTYGVQAPAGVVFEARAAQALGGFSALWGAQLLRYTQSDLDAAGDWPIGQAELDPHYRFLERHVAFSGQEDDMHAFLGGGDIACAPTALAPAAQQLLHRYSQWSRQQRRLGLIMGRPRIGCGLKVSIRQDAPFAQADFLRPYPSGVYNSAMTVRHLLKSQAITLMPLTRLLRFEEKADHVELHCRRADGQALQLRARHLLVGAGTISTARIVASSLGLQDVKLPFLDHGAMLLPLWMPRLWGGRQAENLRALQLIGSMEHEGRRNMIGFYAPVGMMASDHVKDIPLPLPVARRFFELTRSGMLVAQVWQACAPRAGNVLAVTDGERLQVSFKQVDEHAGAARALAGLLRSLGCLIMGRWARPVLPTWAFHHAATLPMKTSPLPLQTHVDGRLHGFKRVRIIDASVLPSLPAKNHSFTMMANASRIAHEVRSCGY